MTTTLRSEVELIIRELSGGDVPIDSPYDPDYIAMRYRSAMAQDCKMEMLLKRQNGEEDKGAMGLYIATYKVEVLIDDMTKRAYAGIPESFMSMKFNRGIVDVLSFKPEASHLLNSILAVDNPNVSSHLVVGQTEMPFRYLEGLRIYFTRDIKKDKIMHVLLKLLVPGAESYGWDDPLPVIPENVDNIRDLVKNRILNRVPQDRISDGNPNLRSTNEQPK